MYNDELFGVACYEKIAVSSDDERGARMKSVSVLTQSPNLLHIHCLQISQLVRWDNSGWGSNYSESEQRNACTLLDRELSICVAWHCSDTFNGGRIDWFKSLVYIGQFTFNAAMYTVDGHKNPFYFTALYSHIFCLS